MLQQEHHNIHVSKSWSYMQRSLFLLQNKLPH
jgi:hypothetical protein